MDQNSPQRESGAEESSTSNAVEDSSASKSELGDDAFGTVIDGFDKFEIVIEAIDKQDWDKVVILLNELAQKDCPAEDSSYEFREIVDGIVVADKVDAYMVTEKIAAAWNKGNNKGDNKGYVLDEWFPVIRSQAAAIFHHLWNNVPQADRLALSITLAEGMGHTFQAGTIAETLSKHYPITQTPLKFVEKTEV